VVPTYTVRMRGVTVGWSDLEQTDDGAGVATGAFRPGPGYDLVQPIFRLYAEAVPRGASTATDEAKLARYHAARERLGLTLHGPRGGAIPTAALHVYDYTSEAGADALRLEARLPGPGALPRG
jgi:hypothetical protein